MMKKYLAIALLFLFIPSVMASLSIDSIRGYVNNERIIDVDKNGGDFDVVPGDILDLVIRLQNDANTTVQAKLVGTIESIDNNADITKTQDYFDIGANDDSSKTLSFVIPSNARNDEFNMELEIFNGSGNTITTIDYNVMVDTRISENEVSIVGILLNLTNSCNAIIETTNTCFNYIGTANNCTSELSTVKEERGNFKQDAEDCSGSLDGVRLEKAELEREKISLNNRIDEMVTKVQCANQTASAIMAVKKSNEDKFNQTFLFIGGGTLIYFYYQKRKKAKSSVAGAYEDDYYDKS